MSGKGLRTLGVSLWGGQQRGADGNLMTLAAPARQPGARNVAVRAKQLFIGAYDRFRDTCRVVEEPGLAVVAVDEATGRAEGVMRLIARIGRPVAAIIGRHDRCDLYLKARELLSLRHLAVVVDPVTSFEREARVRYRLLDLRTSQAMTDEDGKPLRGLVADGPAIVRCAGYVLFCLPIGDPSDWPDSGKDAWTMLPERVYDDELVLAEGSLPKIRLSRDVNTTYVTRTGGPKDTSMRLASGPVTGVLELATPRRTVTLQICQEALSAGVLLGRYDRCDVMEAAGEDESLSRVHALLIQVDDRLLLIDTASTNGTFQNGERTRIVELDSTSALRIGKRTHVRWQFVA